jgi:hypothetical protein
MLILTVVNKYHLLLSQFTDYTRNTYKEITLRKWMRYALAYQLHVTLQH